MDNPTSEETAETDKPQLKQLIANINCNNNNSELGITRYDLQNDLQNDQGKMTESMDGSDLDTSKYDYLADDLSINVSITDLEMFCDTEDNEGDTEGNEDTEKHHMNEVGRFDDEDDDEDNQVSAANSISSLNTTDTEIFSRETLCEQKSKLHCQLCGELYTKPIMLDCLHTFCYACLEKGLQQKKKLIFCAICRYMTNVKGGLPTLPVNSIISKLIESESNKDTNENCIVCKMHHVDAIATYICRDCGDELCDECAGKHTFTRLTATHTVISLVNVDEDDLIGDGAKERFGMCKKHMNEELKYICHDCKVAVCRDCLMLSHQRHNCVSQAEVHTEISKTLQTLIQSLNSKVNYSKQQLDDSLIEDFDFLLKQEKKQEDTLHRIAANLIKHINMKVEKGLDELHEEYEKKRRYSKTRKEFIERNKGRVAEIVENVEFLLKEGTASEILPLKGKIKSRLEDLQQHVDKTFVRVTDLSLLPKILSVNDNIRVMKQLSYFKLHTYETKDLGKPATNKSINSDRSSTPKSKSKVSEREMKEKSNRPVRQPFIGRGQCPSLLGDYPGGPFLKGNSQQGPKNVGGIKLDLGGNDFKGFAQNSMRNIVMEKPSMGGIPMQIKSNSVGNRQTPVNLTFHSSISTQLPTDRHEGRIAGLTFVGKMNFAVSDSANNRLKVFTLGGTFLDMIQDAVPMSVTACNNSVIWNADYNSIKVYSGMFNTYETVRQYRKEKQTHPVTSFKHEKYLVLNRENCSVEAFNLSDQMVHSMKPKDRGGRILQDIESIAANVEDHVVLISATMNRLFVTDFDGNWIGEYFEQRWQPGCATIDQCNNIFVTDVRNKRLIMLDPRGRFKCDWPLQIDDPYCVSCNNQGNLLVSGVRSDVYNYTYNY